MTDTGAGPGQVTEPAVAADTVWSVAQRLRAIEDAAPVGIIAVDHAGRVAIWNRTAERMLGWRASEVIGRAHPLVPDDGWTEHASLVARALQGETFSEVETRCQCRDGSSVAVRLSSAPILDGEGRPGGATVVLTDITEYKGLEHQFLQAQKMDAIGRLAGGIAHDFNNFLTTFIGYSELVLDRVRDRPDVAADVEAMKAVPSSFDLFTMKPPLTVR